MIQEKRLLIFHDLREQSNARKSDPSEGTSDHYRWINDLTQNYSICAIGLIDEASQTVEPFIQYWEDTIQFPFILIKDLNELEEYLSKVDLLIFGSEVAPDICKTIIAMAGYHSVVVIPSKDRRIFFP